VTARKSPVRKSSWAPATAPKRVPPLTTRSNPAISRTSLKNHNTTSDDIPANLPDLVAYFHSDADNSDDDEEPESEGVRQTKHKYEGVRRSRRGHSSTTG